VRRQKGAVNVYIGGWGVVLDEVFFKNVFPISAGGVAHRGAEIL